MTIQEAQDLINSSDADFLSHLEQNNLNTNSGISGFYIESGSGIGPVGWEGVTFVGRDAATGERVISHYGGMTLGSSADLIGFGVGAGAFHFSGTPDQFGGWSAGLQVYSGVTAGGSINLDGSAAMFFYGGQLSAGGNLAVGETYRVTVGDQTIYGGSSTATTISNPNTFLPPDEFAAAILSTDSINFTDINVETYPEGLGGDKQITTYRTINHTDSNGETVYYVQVRVLFEGVDGVIRPFSVDNNGNFIQVEPQILSISSSGEIVDSNTECFGPEVPIDMWPLDPAFAPDPKNPFKQYDQDAVRAKIWKKPIHKIRVGDWVVSHDKNGNMVPGYVPRTMINDAKILLDFHGTAVTPGHVYYRPDSKRADKYETLIDVLRDDGMIEDRDGVKLRAATYAPVDGPLDKFVKAVTGTLRPDGGVDIKEQGRIRLGTRFIVRNDKGRKDYSVADLIEAGGGVVGDDELIRVGDGPGIPFHWDFGDTLPKPEDFVLAASGTTLEDIYKAAEWESQGPRLPAPMVLDGGPVQPLKGAELATMPRNEPLNLGHTPG